MEAIAWHFNKFRASQKNRQPTLGEFFSANKNTASSLMREAMQNSLDARLRNSAGPLAVRIYLSGDSRALSSNDIKPFLGEARRHYEAEGSGLRNCPTKQEQCKYLVIEDFNTTGLNGDVHQYEPPRQEENHFYSFFRAEGQSNKSGAARGRWGAGKFVFAKASRIRTFFGLTVRSEDDRIYLVGQAILKPHKLEGAMYMPDGWYGWTEDLTLDTGDEDYIHMPVDSQNHQSTLETFCRTFRLRRRTESGLSIVIPYIDEDVDCD